jgi:hypothetical protein
MTFNTVYDKKVTNQAKLYLFLPLWICCSVQKNRKNLISHFPWEGFWCHCWMAFLCNIPWERSEWWSSWNSQMASCMCYLTMTIQWRWCSYTLMGHHHHTCTLQDQTPCMFLDEIFWWKLTCALLWEELHSLSWGEWQSQQETCFLS